MDVRVDVWRQCVPSMDSRPDFLGHQGEDRIWTVPVRLHLEAKNIWNSKILTMIWLENFNLINGTIEGENLEILTRPVSHDIAKDTPPPLELFHTFEWEG